VGPRGPLGPAAGWVRCVLIFLRRRRRPAWLLPLRVGSGVVENDGVEYVAVATLAPAAVGLDRSAFGSVCPQRGERVGPARGARRLTTWVA